MDLTDILADKVTTEFPVFLENVELMAFLDFLAVKD